MDKILNQVRRARRRLSLQLLVNRLLRCWFVALAMAVVAIAVPKLVAIENLPVAWPMKCVFAGLIVGALVAAIWTLLRGRSEIDAAVEIDRRYGLRERVASSLSMSPDDAKSPAGQALLADALRAVGRVDVGQRFALQLDRRAWLPLVPALLAFLLAALVDNREAQSSIDPGQLTKQQQENAFKALRERLAAQSKKADAKELKDAEGLFRNLEKQVEKMAEATAADRKRSLVQLNDLAKQLEQRREQLGGDKQLRRQLEKMNNLNRGPADKMLDAMKQGNWQDAMKELAKLKEQLASGKLDEESKKALAEQLKQVQEKLAQAAEARKQAIENLKKQIQQQKQQGDLARAGELQQKLDQMQRQAAQMNKLNQLAQKMGQAQQAMEQGDAQAAAEALQQMMQQMEQLGQEMAEGEMLEAALDQLQMAKDALGCKACQGQGCQACGGAGNRFGEKPGNGMGPGRGFGPRPDEKNDVSLRDSRVRQDARRGPAVIVGEAKGGSVRGQVNESIKEQMAAHGSEPADPLVVEQLPKSRREHAEEYFNILREGR